MSGLFWTGGSLNPVRSLAPCIVNHSFPSYHWIYWVGPITGVILAVIIYKLVKALEYESVSFEDHGEMDLPRTKSRKPSSILAVASIHSGYEAVRTPLPKPKQPQPPPAAPGMTAQPNKPAAPASTAAPAPAQSTAPAQTTASAAQAKKDQVDELPECFAD